MRYSLALMGLAALAAASDVHELGKDTFDAFVKDNSLVLAEFFAPWCGHCKALAPEYEEAATTLKEKEIALAKIDCTVEAELCQRFGVEGYPTLKVFRGPENNVPYGGARKAGAIIDYMTRQARPAVSVVTSAEQLAEFQTSDKVVVVAFFAADDKASNATFAEVADEHRDAYAFGATSDPALAEAEGVKVPAIVLYKSFDEGKNTFTDKFTKDAIATFAKTASTPLVGEVGPETYADYMGAGIPLAYIFSESAEERAAIAAELKSVAETYKGKVNFATIDATTFGQHASNLNLEVGKWPSFAIQDTVNNKKYPFATAGDADALSAKAIGAFVKDFVAGKIEPSIKSEPIPETQEGPTTVIVAHTYDDLIINNDKDVLVEFYAPWCGHCKALAPKYDELAALFAGQADKVTIAKIDATANDVPDEIAGFPTIKLFKAGDKSNPVVYSGSRSVEDLVAFIQKEGTNKAAPASADDVSTDDMPAQAPAATKAASVKDAVTDKVKDTVTGKVKEKAAEVVEAVKAAVKDDDVMDEHDEL